MRFVRPFVCKRPQAALQVARFGDTKLSFTRVNSADVSAFVEEARLPPAASLCMTSGDIDRCVVPLRHGVFSLNTTRRAALRCTRS